MPLITVAIPVFNMQAYLERCIDSVLAQTFTYWELVAIDDGSTDRSGEILAHYAAMDPRINIVHQANRGLSAARNAALDVALGDFIAPVDADDWLEPEYLQVLWELCERNHTKISACNHLIERKKALPRFVPVSGEQHIDAHTACHQVLYHGVPDVSAWGKLIHRSLFNQLRYPEGQLYEDTYLIADLLLQAGSIAFSYRPLYHYAIREDSLSRDQWSQTKQGYISSVAHMTEVILARFPDESRGACRRMVHAYLSLRRYYVGCVGERSSQKKELDRTIRKEGREVLADPEAPLRDKIAILAVICHLYDIMWTFYEHLR